MVSKDICLYIFHETFDQGNAELSPRDSGLVVIAVCSLVKVCLTSQRGRKTMTTEGCRAAEVSHLC